MKQLINNGLFAQSFFAASIIFLVLSVAWVVTPSEPSFGSVAAYTAAPADLTSLAVDETAFVDQLRSQLSDEPRELPDLNLVSIAAEPNPLQSHMADAIASRVVMATLLLALRDQSVPVQGQGQSPPTDWNEFAPGDESGGAAVPL